MSFHKPLAACLATILFAGAAHAADSVTVTRANFARAESDRYMATQVKDGGLGKLTHRREPVSVEQQPVIRINRDTLYSSGVFDLNAGPVTITMPDAGKRFMSLMTVNEDHYATYATYDAGPHTFDKKQIGTRYLMVAIRTLVDPNNAKDVADVHRLQDAIKVEQASAGVWETPTWDQASQNKVRAELLAENGKRHGDSGRAFGPKDAVDPQDHLIATAAGWGGNAARDALYLFRTPPANDGKTVHQMTVKDVPVDGFWSVTVYNDKGYLEKNALNAYSLNSVTAKTNDVGATTVQFGGCDGKVENCLPTPAGWNYIVRLYRPRPEILNGSWKFPEANPVPTTARTAP